MMHYTDCFKAAQKKQKMSCSTCFSFFTRWALGICVFIFAFSCATQKPLGERPLEEEPAPIERLPDALPPVPDGEGGALDATPAPPEPDYLDIAAVGDNLYHDPMIALITKQDPVDPSDFYSGIAPLIENADIAFVNQETVLAGKDFGYSGYPQFNTPQIVGDALIAAGFNVVNHATNHIMDKGEKAVFATMDFWDNHPEIACLGVYRSEEASGRPVIIEKNNITIGFLSYTYGTNGLPVPKSMPYLVPLINDQRIVKDLAALRPNCDPLIVSMHWGEEYRLQPTKEQERLAQLLADHKADVIIGHHPPRA
ncbi:MAG: CapA family protein [Treponema sp.]|jgi:poly-gamma-glutamate synthesis protein (capsule biosynthesis protein)|nr:CapA family protein [Treponema sp.]